MPPRKGGRKRGAGRGRTGGRGMTGGGSGGSGGVADDPEVEEIIDLNPYRPEQTAHVEVVYVEASLRRRQLVPQQGPIRHGWLQGCVNDSVEDWREHLLGVEAEDLAGTIIPGTAQSYPDLAPGKGVVLVELQAHPEKALTSQIATEKGKSLAMHEVVEEMRKAMKAMEQTVGAKVDEACQEARRDAQEARREREKLETQLEKQVGAFREEVGALREEVGALRKENGELKNYMKRGLELGNKVKKRVALTLARVAVESLLGRKKEEDESWFSYFVGLSDAEWETVGIGKKLVKDLLADGAYQFNESIHNIPPEEVVGSIVAMRPGSLRAAWEEIFSLAFNRKVSDEVFKEEVDYVKDQKRILGQD